MTNEQKIAYMAGIFDGEGYFGIGVVKGSTGNTCYYNRIYVGMNKIEAIQMICDFFNQPMTFRTVNSKPFYCFAVGKTDRVVEVLTTLLPYLTVKKEAAKIVLELAHSKKTNKLSPLFIEGRFHGTASYTKPNQDYYASLYHSLKQIQGYDSTRLSKV